MGSPDEEFLPWEAAVQMLLGGRDLASAQRLLYDAIVQRKIQHKPHIPVGLGGRLNSANGEFRHHANDRNPRYLSVLAVDFHKYFVLPSSQSPKINTDYIPGYLSLILEAIEQLNINSESQPKAETLQAWFEKKTVNGKNVSANLAKSMATIARLPERQIGGAMKRRPKG